jgi:hypothetical protein
VVGLTLQDLGNLGELIAAIATIATLIYLALQIRQNAKSIQGSTSQSLVNLEVDTFALIAQHANVFRRGCANIADLDADERVVFDQLVLTEISRMYAGFAQYQNGLITESELTEMLSDWQHHLVDQPGFQTAWAGIKHSYPDDFCRRLDEAGVTARAAT